MRANIFVLSLCFVALVTAQAVNKTIKLNTTDPDPYKLTVQKGDCLTLEMEGNPTTGYTWFLEDADSVKKNKIISDTNLDDRDTVEFLSQKTSKDLTVGRGGIYQFRFNASQVGNETLDFVYMRSFSGSVDTRKTVNVNVVAKSNNNNTTTNQSSTQNNPTSTNTANQKPNTTTANQTPTKNNPKSTQVSNSTSNGSLKNTSEAIINSTMSQIMSQLNKGKHL